MYPSFILNLKPQTNKQANKLFLEYDYDIVSMIGLMLNEEVIPSYYIVDILFYIWLLTLNSSWSSRKM